MLEKINLERMVNIVCGHLPIGCVVTLEMEHGSADVNLIDTNGDYVNLPDTTDKTIIEQLNDALLVANGWVE